LQQHDYGTNINLWEGNPSSIYDILVVSSIYHAYFNKLHADMTMSESEKGTCMSYESLF